MNYSELQKRVKERNEKKNETQSLSAPTKSSSFEEIRDRVKQRNSTSVDSDYITSFINDTKSYFDNLESDWNGLSFDNSKSLNQKYSSAYDDFTKRANNIRNFYNENKSNYSASDYKKMMDYLGSVDDSVANSWMYFKGNNDYYSQWDSEESYKNYISSESYKRQQTAQNMANAAMTSDDYKQFSEAGANIENPSFIAANGVRGPLSRFWANSEWDGNRFFAKDVGNIVSFSRDNSWMLEGDASFVGDYKYTKMTNDEVGVYNYYLAKENAGLVPKGTAQSYLENINETLNQRVGAEKYNQVANNMALEMLFGVNAGLDQFNSGVVNLGNAIAGNKVMDATPTQYASGMVRENLANTDNLNIFGNSLGQTVYDTITTTSNMIPSILASAVSNVLLPGSGEIVGAGLLGGSAGGNAYQEMLNQGYNVNQARAYGAITAISEAGLQYALGGVAKLGGKLTSPVIKKFADGLNSAAAKIAIEYGGEMLSEGVEEGLQEVLNPYFKAIATGEAPENVDWGNVFYSAMLGAISSVPFNAGGNIQTNIATKNAYKGMASELVANAMDENAGQFYNNLAQKSQAKLDKGKNLSGRDLRFLTEATVSKDTSKIASAAEQRLTELGETTDAKSLSEAIAKKVSGEELTTAEKKTLKNGHFTDRVLDELNPTNIRNGSYDTEWTESIGTSLVNSGYYGVSETKKQIAKEVATKKFDISKEKFEKNVSDSAQTDVKSIKSIENGQMMLEKNDGTVVNSDDVVFNNDDDLILYESVKNAGYSTEMANAIIEGYKSSNNMTVAQYLLGIDEGIKYGQIGYNAKSISNDGFYGMLTDTQKTFAYNLGQSQASKSFASKQSNIDALKNGQKVTRKGTVALPKGVTEKSLSGIQKASFDTIKYVTSKFSRNHVEFFESVEKDGKRVLKTDVADKKTGDKAPNGWYDPATGTIYLDLNAGSNGEGVMLFTFAHELTHYIYDYSPAKFKKFADFVIKNYAEKGNDVEALIQRQMELAKANGRTIDRDTAYQEVIADSAQAMFTDTNLLEKLNKIDDKGLVGKIKEFIDKMLSAIKEAYESLNPYSVEGNIVKEWADKLEEMSDLFADALKDAGDTFARVGVVFDASTESVAPSMMSERTWTASEYVRQKSIVAESIAAELGISKRKAIKYIDNINSIAKMIANDRTRLDYVASEGVSSFVSNTEYGGSIDFSTICKKRRLLTGTFSAIQKALPNTALTAEEVLTIRKIMKDRDLEVSCGLCYVEGSGAKMGEYAKDFLDQYAKTNPSYLPNMAEINTPEGIEGIRIKHPEVYGEYVKYMNSLAQRKPKLYQMATEYKGEVLDKFKDSSDVESKNKNGGLRLQSFSDFEIIHLIDAMQVIMDMSRVGLAGQAYTKVPDFAYALGGTGLKINLSLIAKGVDSDGHIILDEVEGMKKADAEKLRNMYSDNVGTILVVFNDEQLKAALADDFIDYIIPFHRSQWNSQLYDLMGLPANAKDYTSYQNESFVNPVYNKNGKKIRPDNYMPNNYWDFKKSGKANAEAYLKMCADNNRKPKFSNLLVNNGDGSYSLQPDGSTDGYWKLLIDFKMYNNEGKGVPQKPVKPDFNMDESERMLNEYKGGHESFPVAQGVVDDFVKKYKGEQKKYSDRLTEDYLEKSTKKYGNVEKAAIDHFGLTDDFRVAGYILTDGKMLDFSGAHWLEGESPEYIAKWKKQNDIRQVDHEDIYEAFDIASGKSAGDNRLEFLKRGNIRISPEAPGIDIATEPTAEQYEMIRKFLKENPYNVEGFYVDIEGETKRAEKLTYSGKVNADKVISDIKYYYANGAVRDNSLQQFLYSDRDSEGNKLTKEQIKFFKDSKVRDENGNLRVLYHGTNYDKFNIFDWKETGKLDGGYFGRGFYFAFSKGEAEYYGRNTLFKVYLNLKNPFVFNTQMYEFNPKASDVFVDSVSFLITLNDKFPEIAKNYTFTKEVYNEETGESEGAEVTISEMKDGIEKLYKSKELKIVEFTGYDSYKAADGEWYQFGAFSQSKYDHMAKYFDDDYMSKYGKDMALEHDNNHYYSKEEAEKDRLNSAIRLYLKLEKIYMPVRSASYYIEEHSSEFTEALKKMGYDGVLQSLNGDEAVAFYPEQIKEVSNLNPTSNPDIRYSDRVLMGSLFSGGGTLEKGLIYQMVDKEFAVEWDGKIAELYKTNNGADHLYVGDVQEFDSTKKKNVFYLHASPSCKAYSKANNRGGESELDRTTATATARILGEQLPTVFTMENVPEYEGSTAYNIIADKLKELGYNWDVNVYDSSDYGNATSRKRLIIRAVRDGLELPSKPEKVSKKTSWGEATKDLWKTELQPSNIVESMMKAIRNTKGLKNVQLTKLDKPIIIMSTSSGGTVSYAYADEVAPTVTTKCGDARVIMNGKVYRPTPEFIARLQGFDNYKFEGKRNLTTRYTVMGNGIPAQLTKAVMGGVLDSAYEQTHEGKKLYSDRDSEGNKLTKEQIEFFKNSKVRDEQGRLKKLYHGTQSAGFTTFDPKHSDDGISFFFTDSEDVANSYSGSELGVKFSGYDTENLESFNELLSVMANDQYAPEGYRVFEENGEYVVKSGERVYTDDGAEVYDENDMPVYDYTNELYRAKSLSDILNNLYEATGHYVEPKANYEVYLNLENPLVVNAEGSEWDQLSVFHIEGMEEREDDFGYLDVEVLSKKDGVYVFYYGDAQSNTKRYSLSYDQVVDQFGKQFAEFIKDAPFGMNHNVMVDKDGSIINPDTLITTRDFALYAKEHGYDGVIFNDITDIGAYSGYEGTSNVYIAFNSNQVKSAENKTPTKENPDIRYSSRREWHTGMTDKEVKMLEERANIERKNNTNFISDTDKWMLYNSGNKSYFALYSLEDVNDKYGILPTIMYASKGKRAIDDAKIAKAITNRYGGVENGSSAKRRSGTLDRLFQRNWDDLVRNNVLNSPSMGYASDKRNVRVFIGNTQYELRRSYQNCLDNISKISSARLERKLSDRTSESFDTRTLLSNALATTAQNDIEKQKIADYQSNIARLNEEQKKLADLKAQIKEISFGKGKRDTDKLKKLQTEATKTANRINIYDKKLLTLEATSILKDVVQREKQKAIRRVEAEGRAALDAYREKALADRQKMAEKFKERNEQRKLNAYRSDLRKKIKKLVDQLSTRELNPKTNKYIPAELIKPVADLLSALNVGSGKSENIMNHLYELKVQYDAIRENPRYSVSYDETVSEMIQALIEEIGNTTIYDMTDAQLEKTYNTLQALMHTIKTAIKVRNIETEMNAMEISTEMRKETAAVPKASSSLPVRWLQTQLRPETMFERFAGFKKDSMWSKVFQMLNKGQLNKMRIEMESNAIFKDVFKNLDYVKSLSDTKNLWDVGIKDETGEKVLITRGMALTLYKAMQNQDNFKHLMMGGFTVPDLKKYYSGADDAWGVGHKTIHGKNSKELVDLNEQIHDAKESLKGADEIIAEAIRNEIDLLEEQKQMLYDEAETYMMDVYHNIEGKFTLEDLTFLQATAEFFDVYSKKELNKTTMELYGFEKALITGYLPIHTDPNFRKASFESITKDMNLENSGFMKDRVHASNPILLEDLSDIINGQIEKVATYCGFTIPVKDFGKIYGKTEKGFQSSLQDTIVTKFGQPGKDYIENLLSDIVGSRRTQSTFFDRARGYMAGATLSINPRVALAQAASYPTAAAELGWKPLGKAIGMFAKKHDFDLIAKYTPLLYNRSNGADVDLADIKTFSQPKNVVMRKLNWLMGWIEMFDKRTVGTLWYASQFYVDDNFGDLAKGTDAYYMKVAEVFNRVVERTQPNYSVLQRPDILRNPNAVVKQLTMFMTQRLQNMNIVYESASRLNKYKSDLAHGLNDVTPTDVEEAKVNLTMAVSSQLIAAGVIVGIKFIVDALMHSMNAYRDDDKDLTPESVSWQWLNNFLDTVIGNLLGGSELYKVLYSIFTKERYYGVSLNGVGAIADAIEDFVGLAQKPSLSKCNDLAKSICTFLGIPLGNAEKIGIGLAQWIEDIVNGDFGKYEAGVDRTVTQNIRRSYEAYTNGDTKKFESITIEEKNKATVTKYLKDIYFEAYDKNDASTMANIRKYMKATKLYDDPVKTCQDWIKNRK